MPDTPKVSCPKCATPGTPVSRITVKALVLDDYHKEVLNSDYWACLSPSCPVGYYAAADQGMIPAEHLKVPLHYKEDAHPRYACYCNKVTEAEVKKIIQQKGRLEMPQIIRLLRDEVQSDCRHRNPLGHCCSERFHQVIEQALQEREPHESGPSD